MSSERGTGWTNPWLTTPVAAGGPDASRTDHAGAARASAFSALALPGPLLQAKAAVEQSLRADVARAASAAPAAPRGPANVQGVAVGQAMSRVGSPPGGAPGDYVLTLFLVDRVVPEDLRSVLTGEMGVAAAGVVDGVPVHPVVTGYVDAQPHRLRLRPAPAGDSIGHHSMTAGTLGCLAVGRTPPRDSRLLVLSNNHVLANANDAVEGDCIVQPGSYDGGHCPDDQVAMLERFVPLQFGGEVNHVDCAVGWTWPDRVRPELMQIADGQPNYYRASGSPVEAQLGQAVGKSGRTTQVTSGRVDALGASVWVNYGEGRSAYFEDQVSFRGNDGDFSAGGDSGSLIWTWDPTRSPVALLFAGGGGVTFGNRIGPVLDALDVNLYL